MLYILMFIAVIIFAGCIIGCMQEDADLLTTAIWAGIPFVVAALFLGGVFIAEKSYNKDTYEVKTATHQIVSLQDTEGIEGEGVRRFLSGYLSISTNGKYVYYYKTEKGSYKQGEAKGSSADIYEQENCDNPRVEIFTTHTKSRALWKIMLFKKGNEFVSTRYEIYVPKGTVVKDTYQVG